MNVVLIMSQRCWACDAVQEFIERNGLPVSCVLGIQRLDMRLDNPCTGMFQVKKDNGDWLTDGLGNVVEVGPFEATPVLSINGGEQVISDVGPIKAWLCKAFDIKDSAVLVSKTMGGV